MAVGGAGGTRPWVAPDQTAPPALWHYPGSGLLLLPLVRRFANYELARAVELNATLASHFTKSQLRDIKLGLVPRGYVWHHHQAQGKLQLVDRDAHRRTGHTGGRSTWGGGGR